MTLPEDPAQRHRAIAARFTQTAGQTTDWQAPAPVEGWTAREVVRHLIDWSRGFLAGSAGIAWQPLPVSVDDDPAAAWRAHADSIQALLDDPATASRAISDPHVGSMPLAVAIDRLYTSDVFMHTWDLARAGGLDDVLDADQCAALLSGMEEIEDLMRSSGQYGARVTVPEGADAQTRMLGFIGRDPQWQRPASA